VNKVVLGALIAGSGYVTGFSSPNPALTRVAPDRVEPYQRPLSLGFWGASAEFQLIGPDLDAFYGRRPSAIPAGYPMTVNFSAALEYDHPELKPLVNDVAQRGFLRMVPSLWYGVRADEPDRLVPNGTAACSGRFFLFKPRSPNVPVGWRLVSQSRRRVSVPVWCEYEAGGGGGARFWLTQPSGWRLEDIGLTTDHPYTADFSSVWDSALSEWQNAKPPRDVAMTRFMFRPTVWAEVVEATIVDERTGERRQTTTPTGWVEAAGRFHRART